MVHNTHTVYTIKKVYHRLFMCCTVMKIMDHIKNSVCYTHTVLGMKSGSVIVPYYCTDININCGEKVASSVFICANCIFVIQYFHALFRQELLQ